MCSQVSFWMIKKQIKNQIYVNSGDLGGRENHIFAQVFWNCGIFIYICSSVNGIRTKSSKIYAENVISSKIH